MAKRYQPPQQSVGGQFFDVIFLLALVFAALFVPVWLKIAVPSRVEKLPDGVTYQAAADGDQDLDRADLGEARAEPDHAGSSGRSSATPSRCGRGHHHPAVRLHDRHRGRRHHRRWSSCGYFVFLLVLSEKEYKQVIAEKFD